MKAVSKKTCIKFISLNTVWQSLIFIHSVPLNVVRFLTCFLFTPMYVYMTKRFRNNIIVERNIGPKKGCTNYKSATARCVTKLQFSKSKHLMFSSSSF